MKGIKRKLSGWENAKRQQARAREDAQLSLSLAKWRKQNNGSSGGGLANEKAGINVDCEASQAGSSKEDQTENPSLRNGEDVRVHEESYEEDTKIGCASNSKDCSEEEADDYEVSDGSLAVATTDVSNGSSGFEHRLPDMSCKNQPLQIPPYKSGNRAHNFLPRWFLEFPWLHFVESTQVIVCFSCVQAQRKNVMSKTGKPLSKLATGEGCKNWKKAENVFKNHQNSSYHKTAVVKLDGPLSTPVTSQIDESLRTQQREVAKALRVMFQSLLYVGRQGLALRGNTSASGNYVNLVRMLSEHVPELGNFLKRKKNYLSPEIQNEMAEIAAHFILREVVREIKKSEVFSVIVDETSDISGREQVSINVRIVDDNLDVDEIFLGLYETSDMTGKALFDFIMDALRRFDIPVQRLRGQTYDGGRNMSGLKRGVQKRVIDIQPLAMYIHCFNHCLNLAWQDAAKAIPLVRDCMQWTNDIGVVIRNSPKRMQRFKEICVSSTDTEGEGDGRKASISVPRPLCPTRFSVRTPALTTLKNQYSHVIHLLDELADSKEDVASKARGLHDQLLKSEIYFGSLMCQQIFDPCERLSISLQTRAETVSGAIAAAKCTREELQKMRDDEHFDKLWADMKTKETSFHLLPPRLPRKHQVPRKLDQSTNASQNHNFETAKEKLRATYFETLDTVIGEIDSRFFQEGIQSYQHLENAVLRSPEDWTSEVFATLEKYGVDKDDLRTQIGSFHELAPERKNLKSIVAAFKALHKETKGLFPELVKVLQLLLVVAASSATAERSFSTLKRLKTYLRSTMSQERLNHLAILNVYKDRAGSIDVRNLCQESVNKDYRVAIFGGVNEQ